MRRRFAFRPRSVVLSFLLTSACGDVSGTAADAGLDGENGSDGGADAPAPDGAPPPFVRVFHTAMEGSATFLYSADILNGLIAPAVKLSTGTANPSTTVTMPVASADGRVVVYAADAETEGDPALYLVRFGAGGPEAPVQISGAHGGGNYVVSTFLTPDGSKAIYGWGAVGSFVIGTSNYFVVDLSGASPGTPVGLYGGGETFLSNPVLSEDGRRFGFVDSVDAFVVDLAPGVRPAGVAISAAGVAGTTVAGLALSPNGARASYVSDAEVNDVMELWVVDVSGPSPGTPQRGSAPLASNHDVATGYFAPVQIFSADGGKLAYLEGVLSSDLYELYVVDVSGTVPGAARKVNGTLVSGGGVGNGGAGTIFTSFFRFAPDGQAIFYTADQRFDDTFELFSVDLSSAVPAAPQRISANLVSGGDALDFRIAPDGSGVAYAADQRVDDVRELFYVDLRGAAPSTPQVVNGNLAAGGDIYRYGLTLVVAFSADGGQLAYAADQTVDQRTDVFLVDVAGGVPSAALPVGAATFAQSIVAQVAFARDGVTLLFTQSAVTSTQDLWASDIRGAAPTTPAMVNTAPSVGAFFLAP